MAGGPPLLLPPQIPGMPLSVTLCGPLRLPATQNSPGQPLTHSTASNAPLCAFARYGHRRKILRLRSQGVSEHGHVNSGGV
jgi:hypothetical protein